MKGKIGFDAKMKRYYVSWYMESIKQTKKLWFYKGIKLETESLAQKLLAAMQGDVENGTFRIEKFTQYETDIVPYLRSWLKAIKPTITPATYNDYKNSIENHLAPFFKTKLINLNEIEYDTLVELVGTIKRTGKGKINVMYCLHACLDYAWRSRRLQSVPPFPKKKLYQIVEPVIKWLPSDRQEALINAIPLEHQPIFWWLKYHLRRPGEAMALRKEDYEDGVFQVHRGFSAKQQIDRTKTGECHIVPAVSSFMPYLEIEQQKQKEHGIVSPYFFVNPFSKKEGKHYTLVTLERIWNNACAVMGEDIDLYHGTKHSTASQMINELDYSQSELQMAGDWARLESVKKYGKVEVSARKNLLEGRFKTTQNEIARDSKKKHQ